MRKQIIPLRPQPIPLIGILVLIPFIGIAVSCGNIGGDSTGSSGGGSNWIGPSTLPNAPSAFTITAVADTRINLAWTDNATNEDGFMLERRVGSGTYQQIALVNANVITYSDTTISPATPYTYRIASYNATGNSDYSNEASTTTLIVKRWGGPENDAAMAVARDSAGNIYTTGWTNSYGSISSTPSEMFVIKYDSAGSLLWQRTWGGGGTDGGNSIAVTQAGDIYITGSTDSFGVVSTTDVFLIKYTTDGSLVWQRTWGGNSSDRVFEVALDENAVPVHIYVTGATNSFGSGYDDAFLLSYDASGTLNWQRVWGGTASDGANALNVDSLGNIYVAGGTNSFGSNSYDAFLLKYDSSGSLVWQRTLGDIGDEITKDIVIDASDGIYITGDAIGYGTGAYDIFLANYNSAGTVVWQTIWGGPAGDELAQTIGVSGQNIYVSGYTNSFGDQTNNIFVLRYDLNSVVQSQKLWGTTGADMAYTLVPGLANNVYLVGETNGANGDMRTISGTISDSAAASSTPTGTQNFPVGTETTPAGFEETPTGIETGSTNSDAIMIMVTF